MYVSGGPRAPREPFKDNTAQSMTSLRAKSSVIGAMKPADEAKQIDNKHVGGAFMLRRGRLCC